MTWSFNAVHLKICRLLVFTGQEIKHREIINYLMPLWEIDSYTFKVYYSLCSMFKKLRDTLIVFTVSNWKIVRSLMSITNKAPPQIPDERVPERKENGECHLGSAILFCRQISEAKLEQQQSERAVIAYGPLHSLMM